VFLDALQCSLIRLLASGVNDEPAKDTLFGDAFHLSLQTVAAAIKARVARTADRAQLKSLRQHPTRAILAEVTHFALPRPNARGTLCGVEQAYASQLALLVQAASEPGKAGIVLREIARCPSLPLTTASFVS